MEHWDDKIRKELEGIFKPEKIERIVDLAEEWARERYEDGMAAQREADYEY